ncbi:MAG: hypothetical protein ACREQE_12125, partial [Candidatus Binataceae bacterium]
MEVVNAIAVALADSEHAPPVAYLAYHDTLAPDPKLRPQSNVWFEWAPRERCYSHAIDDSACEVNPRYFDALKRYIDLFDGRGHVFEYYADAILFGGLGFATPTIIVRDLRAYRALGLGSGSCLTFGAWSSLVYPVNLDAFARGSRSPDFEPGQLLADTAAARYPRCAPAMTEAYRALERASGLILNGGGDVMRPRLHPPGFHRRDQLRDAVEALTRAIEAADHVAALASDRMIEAERAVWHYGRAIVIGISEYLTSGREARTAREAAIEKVGAAIHHVRSIDPSIKGTWGAYDLERFSEIWLAAMRRRLEENDG